MRLYITDYHCPGDTLEDTQVVRDIRASCPDIAINVDTTAPTLWDNNPHLDRSITRHNADRVIPVAMPLIHQSNQNGLHVCDCIREYMAQMLQRRIAPGPRRVDIHLSDAERDDTGLYARLGVDVDRPYWLVNAGYKDDFPLKHWGHDCYQAVVDATRDIVQWVQVGAAEGTHHHLPLAGAVDLRGRTTHRDLVRLMYRASGALTGISYLMHLASMEWCGRGASRRPCVVIAGGREPDSFSFYPGQRRFSAVGLLPCCRDGGCWRGQPRDCKSMGPDGHPECMRMIRPAAVADCIRRLASLDG